MNYYARPTGALTEELFCAGTFQLVYGNPLVAGTRSTAIKADSIVHAVILVLGGAYKVGRLFGHVEKIK